MFKLKWLRDKILLLVVGIVTVLGLSIFVFINHQISYEVRTNVTWDLFKTKSAFEEFQEISNTQLLSNCRITAELPMLKGALSTKDHLTMLHCEQELQKIVNSDIFIVTDEHGVILASVTEPDKYGDATLEISGVDDALRGQESVATVALPSSGLYQVALCPIKHESEKQVAGTYSSQAVAGVLVLGLLIDDEVARNIKIVTESDMVFTVPPARGTQTGEGQIAASSFPWPANGLLQDALLQHGKHDKGCIPLNVTAKDEDFLSLCSVIKGADEKPVGGYLIFKSLSGSKALLRNIEQILFVITIFICSGAALIGFFFARGITKPIRILSEGAERVAYGDLSHRITVKTRDEIGALAVTFNEMIGSLERAKVCHERDIEILKETQFTTMIRLAMLAEKRDPETGEHLERIKEYSRLLAEGLRCTKKYKGIIDDEFIEMLVQSSPLHDIGKVAIPDNILLKNGRLTKDEFELMKQHAIKGAEILEGPEFLRMGYEIALAHHEKYNGTGYPYGLSGDAIPLSARIVALTDVYDALTTKRVYKEAISHEEAYSIILSESGKSFDPEIVRVFKDNVETFIEIKERSQPVLTSSNLHNSQLQTLNPEL